jgi:hypothetical protein
MSNVIVIIIVLILVAAAGWYVWTFHPEWIPKFILEKISNRKTVHFTSTLPAISDSHARGNVWGTKSSPMLNMLVPNPNNMDLDFYFHIEGYPTTTTLLMNYNDNDLDKLNKNGLYSVDLEKSVWVSVIKNADHFQIYIFTETPNNKGASEFTYDELREIPSKFRIWWNIKGGNSVTLTSTPVAGSGNMNPVIHLFGETWSEYTYELKW